jgi:hypothetical protein
MLTNVNINSNNDERCSDKDAQDGGLFGGNYAMRDDNGSSSRSGDSRSFRMPLNFIRETEQSLWQQSSFSIEKQNLLMIPKETPKKWSIPIQTSSKRLIITPPSVYEYDFNSENSKSQKKNDYVSTIHWREPLGEIPGDCAEKAKKFCGKNIYESPNFLQLVGSKMPAKVRSESFDDDDLKAPKRPSTLKKKDRNSKSNMDLVKFTEIPQNSNFCLDSLPKKSKKSKTSRLDDLFKTNPHDSDSSKSLNLKKCFQDENPSVNFLQLTHIGKIPQNVFQKLRHPTPAPPRSQ